MNYAIVDQNIAVNYSGRRCAYRHHIILTASQCKCVLVARDRSVFAGRERGVPHRLSHYYLRTGEIWAASNWRITNVIVEQGLRTDTGHFGGIVSVRHISECKDCESSSIVQGRVADPSILLDIRELGQPKHTQSGGIKTREADDMVNSVNGDTLVGIRVEDHCLECLIVDIYF